MGSGASVEEQRGLFNALSSTDDHSFDAVLPLIQSFVRRQELKATVQLCDLCDVERVIDNAFARGKTPLVLDASPDEKFTTFLSYQPDVVLLNAKELITLDHSQSRVAALEHARRALVAAMATGKSLAIRLGTSAPDFLGRLNDSKTGFDTTTKQSAYFPIQVFQRGGATLRDPSFAQSMADGLLIDLPEPELVPRIAGDGEDEEGPEETVDEEKKRGPKTKRLSWSERLFRAADMAPHRNFAICKLSFRCLVVSSLSIDDAAEHLFDIKGQYGLPSPEWFQIICIVPDEEEVAAAASARGEEEEEEG